MSFKQTNCSSSSTSLDSSLSSLDSLPMFTIDETDYSDSSDSSDFEDDFSPIAVVASPVRAPLKRGFSGIEEAMQYGEQQEEETCNGNKNFTFAEDTAFQSSSSSCRQKSSRFSNVFYSLAFCCAAVAMYLLGSQSSQAATMQLKEAEAARDELIQNQERLLNQLAKDRRLPSENLDLIQHVALLQHDLEQTAASLQAEKQRRKKMEQEADKAWEQYDEVIDEMADVDVQKQQDASRLYHQLGLANFGPGPHYAEFEVDIWDGEQAETRYFTVETAPIKHMPASVFLFLEQVDNGLWDGSSIHINAPHVLLAQPLSNDPNVEEQPFTKMERMGLARVPFSEYNEEYMHTAYTLGYGGGSVTPGPNFYINKVDNTDHHEGEPCFSKVIIGLDTIDRMGQLKGSAEHPFYIQPVDIKTVRLVDDLSKVHGGAQYLLNSKNNKNAHHDEH
jgi:hypothetical protein